MQLRLLEQATGSPAELTCGSLTCVITGSVAGDPAPVAKVLDGDALRDTLATWDYTATASTILPPSQQGERRYALVIDRRN